MLVSARVTFPCNHPLRLNPSLSFFFEHCNCNYGEWSEVRPLMNAPAVRTSRQECDTGLKIPIGIRYQLAIEGSNCSVDGTECEACVDKQELMYICATTCRYENVSDVRSVVSPETLGHTVNVPRNQCESEYVYPAGRYMRALSGYHCIGIRCMPCEDKWEDLYICKTIILICDCFVVRTSF